MPQKPPFEVHWTKAAAADLESILQHIAERNPFNAGSIWSRIRIRADALSHFPERGRIVPELKSIGIDFHRELIEEPWRIIYRIRDRKVVVMGIFDGRRELEDILLERLTR
jgi:toxin ParE1/3/4